MATRKRKAAVTPVGTTADQNPQSKGDLAVVGAVTGPSQAPQPQIATSDDLAPVGAVTGPSPQPVTPIGTQPAGWAPEKPAAPKRTVSPPEQSLAEPPGERDRIVQYTYVSGIDPVSGWTVDALRNALISINRGTFTSGGALADDMSANPYVAKCLNDRFNSFTMLPQIFTPTKKRGDGAHCCDFIKEVWPDICPPSIMRTIHRYFLMMGFVIIGMDWEERSDGGKRYWLPQLKPWQPQLTSYIQMTDPRTLDGGQWCALTMNKGLLHVEPGRGRWALVTREGIRPWMGGGVRVLGETFVGWQENFHDNMAFQNRYGRGIMKMFYPRGYNVQEAMAGASSLSQAGGGGVFPCMTNADGKPLVDLDMLKVDGSAFQTYPETEKRLIRNILLYFLGQDMTSIGQTGGYAQARVHQGILWDKREEDAAYFGDARLETRWEQDGDRRRRVSEWVPSDGWTRTQITNWIAYFNYGSWDLAPYIWYDAKEPESEREEADARADRGAKQGSALKALGDAVEKFKGLGLLDTPEQIAAFGQSMGLALRVDE